MKLFGDRLPVISIRDLIIYASRSKIRVRLDICDCKEIGKLVVRVAGLTAGGRKEWPLGMLVDAYSDDYFVSARSADGLRAKLNRLLMPISDRIDIVEARNHVLRLFQGGVIVPQGNFTSG